MRIRFLLIFAACCSVCVPSAHAASSAQFKAWLNTLGQWGGTVQNSNAKYGEGQTIPLRLTTSLAPGTQHTLLLKYDFGAGSQHFFDALRSFDGTVKNADLLAGIGSVGAPLQFPLPLDTTLPAKAQKAGVLTAYNVQSVSFGQYAVVNGVKTLPVTFVVASGGRTNRTIVLGYGAHLAAEDAWGGGNGASAFPGASRKAYASIDGGSDMNISVNPGAILPSADLSVSSIVATPQPVAAGQQLVYDIVVNNLGPDTASSVQVNDTLPASVSFVSASGSQGTLSNSSPVAFTVGTLAAGSSATVRIVTKVGPSPGLSFANSASVTSTTLDPDAANNSATFVSIVRDTTPPLITCPANIVQSTDANSCSALVSFTVGATDERGAVTVTSTPPSGSQFLIGTTLVTSVATDPAGNTATCSFTVTVKDTEAPRINCPTYIVAGFGATGCTLESAFGVPTAVDNCDTTVQSICDPPASTLLPLGTNFITCRATDASGNTATCIFTVNVVDDSNQAWPLAMPLALTPSQAPGVSEASVQQCVSILDQSRWFKFSVKPGNRVFITLTDLPENYDLVLFKDVAAEYFQLQSLNDLVRLNAAFASDAFAPAAFSPDAFAPGAFAPGAFAPGAFAPGAFAPGAFAPGAFAPGAFAPGAFAPDAYAPDAYSPGAFAPGAFAPGAFAPGAFAPGAFAPGAFAAAQLASVLAVSAFEGIANEGIVANTWDNTGDFYIRVRGRNGIFSPNKSFKLNVYQVDGNCGAVTASPAISEQPLAAVSGDYKTLILMDKHRWALSGGDVAAAESRLQALAASTHGIVVDVDADPFVRFFNQQADTNFDCPYGKNLVARAIKGIIDRYWALNPLEYIVLVGSDSVIPFFRYPDEALLGPERNYVPPVKDFTASQASLRLGYVLGQDAYGSRCEFPLKTHDLPLAELSVGRLVETPSEVASFVDSFLNKGGIINPTSSLVTGYDFLADVASAVQDELAIGVGTGARSLISPYDKAPAECWTADDLRTNIFARHFDLMFLAGHFSANGLLAADYTTHILSSEFEKATVDFENSLIYSAGCHSGYNIVDADAIQYVTLDPDWAQACARRKATLVAGTGYQYGDTEFIEYGERLYLEFTKELRTGTGPVSIGKALLNAKRTYLAGTPQMRPIHSKTYLQTTIFGLPMLRVDLPGARRTINPTSPVVTAQPAASNPGAALGLSVADLAVVPALTQTDFDLKDTESGNVVTTTYLSGGDGVVVNPAEPTLPLEIRNVSSAGTVLRGVGFRGATYVDLPGKIPLTGAATTEIRGVHASFLTEVFFPVRPWSVNYLGALCQNGGGDTRLVVVPGQFKSTSADSLDGTIRGFTQMDFRLYYSANISGAMYPGGIVPTSPGLAGPPAISHVSGITGPDGNTVAVQAEVVGDPSAGMQSVWVTYTALSGPFYGKWQSFDLTQSPADSRKWTGTLPLNGTPSSQVRYIVQAVNGVGLVALDTKLGAYHYPDEFESGSTAALAPTSVRFLSPPASGAFGTQAQFKASLTDALSQPLVGKRMVFKLGDQELWATTGADGVAAVVIPLLSLPAAYDVKASFPGAAGFAPTFALTQFTLTRQATTLSIAPKLVYARPNADTRIVATLMDGAGNRMPERTVLFIVSGATSYAVPVITDASGNASLGGVPLPAGNYTVTAWFNGVVPLPTGQVTIDDGRYLPSNTTGALNLVTLVVDDMAPQLVCPANIIQQTDGGKCSAKATFAPVVNDDHPGFTVICNPPSGTVFPKGDTVVQCVATDLAGNVSTCSFLVTVVDRELPVVLCPENIRVPTDPGKPTATVQFTGSATDNCDGTLPVLSSVASGSAFGLGTTTVRLTAKDSSGNTGSCSFTVTVVDQESPVIACPANIRVNTDPNKATAVVTFPLSATDNVDGAVPVVSSYASGSVFPVGVTTVQLSAVDAAGNPSSCSFTVTVVDGQAPTILSISATPNVLFPPNHNMVLVRLTVTASDNLGGPVTASIVSVTSTDPINGTGDGDQSPDWQITGPLTLYLRSERASSGTGRTYTIYVECKDSVGNSSSGTVTVSVPSSGS